MDMFENKPQTSQERKMQERLHMRKVYQNLTSLDSAIQYMKSEDFEKGGWFVLAFQASEIKKIKDDISRIKDVMMLIGKALDKNCVEESKPSSPHIVPLPAPTIPAPAGNEPWITLQAACWNLQKEAISGRYELVFNPHYFSEWIRTDKAQIFEGTYRRHYGSQSRYEILQDAFLDRLVVSRKSKKNKPIHKFDINELERFCIERKQKQKTLPGMCA